MPGIIATTVDATAPAKKAPSAAILVCPAEFTRQIAVPVNRSGINFEIIVEGEGNIIFDQSPKAKEKIEDGSKIRLLVK